MESEAKGWDAIAAALKKLYGEREPLHFGTIVPFYLGGKDPIHGTDLQFNADPVPHWHVITYGFSELWEKESDDPEVSGFGFELTMRVKLNVTPSEAAEFQAGNYRRCTEGDHQSKSRYVPYWALNCLQNLARYVFESGNVFDAGHHVDLQGPIRTDSDSLIRAAAFRLDPVLPPIDTPNGSLDFLQLVGITLDECEAMKRWTTSGVLNLMAEHDPLLIVDLARRSALESPQMRAAVVAGAAREGSSQAYTATQDITWRTAKHMNSEALIMEFPAFVVDDIAEMLKARILFGRNYAVTSDEVEIHFEPSKVVVWRNEEKLLGVDVNPAFVTAFGEKVKPVEGRYRVWESPPIDVIVHKSPIYDQAGNVIRVIG